MEMEKTCLLDIATPGLLKQPDGNHGMDSRSPFDPEKRDPTRLKGGGGMLPPQEVMT